MTTATRNRPTRKAARTETVTAHRLRAGDRLTAWGTREPVVVLDVARTGQRSWDVTVALPAGGVVTTDYTAGEKITRAL